MDDKIIKRYKNHPSIKNIEIQYNSVRNFSFHLVSTDSEKVIRDLKNNKCWWGNTNPNIKGQWFYI